MLLHDKQMQNLKLQIYNLRISIHENKSVIWRETIQSTTKWNIVKMVALQFIQLIIGMAKISTLIIIVASTSKEERKYY